MKYELSQSLGRDVSLRRAQSCLEAQLEVVANKVEPMPGSIHVHVSKVGTGWTSMFKRDKAVVSVNSRRNGVHRAVVQGKCKPSMVCWIIAILGFPGGTILAMFAYYSATSKLQQVLERALKRVADDMQ